MKLIDEDKIMEIVETIEKTLEDPRCNGKAIALTSGIRAMLRYIPYEDVQAKAHGRWTQPDDVSEELGVYVCNVCGGVIAENEDVDIEEYAYCPFCGAKMDSEEEETKEEDHEAWVKRALDQHKEIAV